MIWLTSLFLCLKTQKVKYDISNGNCEGEIMKLEFGRKVSYLPMLICLAVGAVIGVMIYLLSGQALIGVFMGIVTWIVATALYTVSLNNLYGYWLVTDEGIECYNYGGWDRKFIAILFPLGVPKLNVKYSDIKAYSVIAGQEVNAPKNLLGGVYFNTYLPDKILLSLPTPYYLQLTLLNDREIDLDLSWNMDHTDTVPDIEAVVKQIYAKTGLKVDLITQQKMDV